MRTKVTAAVTAALLALVILALIVSRNGGKVAVSTLAASTGAINRQVLASGTLEPVRMVEVGVQVSGTISELPVDFNSVVKAGQVVARLDPSVYEGQLEQARAQLAQARAEAAQIQTALDDATAKFGRAEALGGLEVIAQAELDDARVMKEQAAADLKARQAAIQGAEAGVKQAQVDLERTVVRSPIDGIVVNRAVDVGQTVAVTLQSPVLFTIADVREMNLLTEVDEGEIAGVYSGSSVSFQVESLGPQTFHGTVTEVRLQPYADQAGALVAVATSGIASASAPAGTTGATSTTGGSGSGGGSTATGNSTSASGSATASAATPGAVTYTAVIGVKNGDGRLAPGNTAIVTMGGGSKANVVRLPNNALSFRPSPALLERTGQQDLESSAGGSSDGKTRVSQVWKFEDSRFVPIDVVTGLSDDQWTEMISGAVQAGDQLVTTAAAR